MAQARCACTPDEDQRSPCRCRKITGQIQGGGKSARLVPDDPRIVGPVVLRGGVHGAREGQAVVAEIARYPEHPHDAMEVSVLKVLGDSDDPRTEVEKVLACADVTEEFPSEVARAAAHVPPEVRPNDRKDRVDLRHIPFTRQPDVLASSIKTDPKSLRRAKPPDDDNGLDYVLVRLDRVHRLLPANADLNIATAEVRTLHSPAIEP